MTGDILGNSLRMQSLFEILLVCSAFGNKERAIVVAYEELGLMLSLNQERHLPIGRLQRELGRRNQSPIKTKL